MRLIAEVLYLVTLLFFLLLIGRVILSWIRMFSREWKPRGLVLILAESIYTVTDPPIKLLRKIIPPLSLGAVRLDLTVIILSFACVFAMSIFGSLARSGV